MAISVTVDSSNLVEYTNVQRGTIFMLWITILIVFIGTVIRIVSNKLDPVDEEAGGEQYKENEKKEGAESEQAFDRAVISSQVIEEDDGGSVKFIKKLSEFNTSYMPILIVFPLNIITGTTYAFDFCLYFFVMVPLLLFNLLQLHKKCIDHKIFIVILENLWLILSFFWFVNIWATDRWIQPYYIA